MQVWLGGWFSRRVTKADREHDFGSRSGRDNSPGASSRRGVRREYHWCVSIIDAS